MPHKAHELDMIIFTNHVPWSQMKWLTVILTILYKVIVWSAATVDAITCADFKNSLYTRPIRLIKWYYKYTVNSTFLFSVRALLCFKSVNKEHCHAIHSSFFNVKLCLSAFIFVYIQHDVMFSKAFDLHSSTVEENGPK